MGGRVVSTDGLLELLNRQGTIALVRVLPTARITSGGKPAAGPVALHAQVVTMAYPDPTLHNVYLADAVNIIKNSTQRWGGIIRRIDPSHGSITIYSKIGNTTYTVEVRPQTRITLNRFDAGYADMSSGDHVTIIGALDTARSALGPNPIVARYVRISSPSFGGTIAAIAPAPAGGVVLSVHAHHGHALRIDAPGKTLVYMTTADGQQTARVPDLVVGQHISATGTRVGAFALAAQSIHVYPHQHTVGGAVASILPGRYRITASDGSQTIIHITIHTTFTLNGKDATAAAVATGLHIRVRGYDALHNDERSIPTLIASHVSIIIHNHAKETPTLTPAPAKTPIPTTMRSGTVSTPTATATPTRASSPKTGPSTATPAPTPGTISAGATIVPASADNAV
jgi:hypothetical protein